MSNESIQPVSILRRMGDLVFDAVFEESHESELEVTDNPVETGVIVSDHAYMKPDRVSISAGVSDTPLHLFDQGGVDQFGSSLGRSKRAYELLQELQRTAEPFDVQTGLKLYRNMICCSIRTSQDKDTSRALIFTAELREVLIVYTQTVKYPPRKKDSTARQAGPKKDKGEQQGKEVSAETNKAKKQSLAKKLGSLV